MASVSIRNVTKAFGNVVVLKDFSEDFQNGELITLLGPSGCGKTTLLYGNGTKTIGYELYEYWTFTSQPMACAMAFAILMIVVLLNFVLNKLTKGEFSI